MGEDREWLTEKEIEAVASRLLTAALAQVHFQLNKIADGAQASILSANIMHGNAELGLKGVLPDLQERMTASEERERERDRIWQERHTTHTKWLAKIDRGQHRFRRFVSKCMHLLVQKQGEGAEAKSKPAWLRIVLGVVLTGTSWTTISNWWHVIARKLSAIGYAIAH